MRICWFRIGVCPLACLMVCVLCRADEPAPPRPETVLREAATAYAGIQRLRADAAETVTTTTGTYVLRGQIKLERPNRLFLDLNDDPPRHGITYVSDGKRIWEKLYASGSVARSKPEADGRNVAPFTMLARAFFKPESLRRADLPPGHKLAWLGRKMQAGVLCDVIQEDTRGLDMHSSWTYYIGEDHLLRRETKERHGYFTEDTALTNLKINPVLRDAEFTIPEGNDGK